MERILGLSRSADEGALGALALELAREVLATARSVEDESDRLQAQTIGALTASPERQRLVLGITDRAQRSQSATRTVAAVREVVERVGVGDAWPFVDRLQLSALSWLG